MLYVAELSGLLFNNQRGKQRPEWNRTRLVENRVKKTGFYEEKGVFRKEKFFQGRPIIGRDRKVDGGVYLGGSEREAVVADGKKDPAIEEVYQELKRRRMQAQTQRGVSFKEGLLEEVWRLVRQVMPYNEQKVQNIVESLPKPDTKIYLSAFIGGGVCRHQALLTAYLLERLSEEKLVGGKVSVDRNYVPGKGGHAWVRYENSVGDVFILDPAQNYIGRLDEMSEERDRWFYERPEDTNPGLRILSKLKRMFGI